MQNLKNVFLLLLIQVLACGYAQAQEGVTIDLSKLELKKPTSRVVLKGQKIGNQTLNITFHVKKEKLIRATAVDSKTGKKVAVFSGTVCGDSGLCYVSQGYSCWYIKPGICFCGCGAFKKPDHSPQ